MYPLTQGTASTGLRTIMAYPDSAEGHPGQGVRNFWSNPRMILPESGTPLGVEGVSDNAWVLTKNRFEYAETGDESGQCGAGKHIICYSYQKVAYYGIAVSQSRCEDIIQSQEANSDRNLWESLVTAETPAQSWCLYI